MTTKLLETLTLAEEALHNMQNALLFVSGSVKDYSTSNMTADAHDDADKALAAIREAKAELVKQGHREPTHDEYLELAQGADIIVAHEHCHLNEQEMKKAWVVEYGSQVYGRAWLDGLDSAQPVRTKDPCNPLQDLTDGEISDLWCDVSNTDFVTIDTHVFARAVIAADREKNK